METTIGKIRIGLIEDQLLFRKGIKAILSVWPEIEVIFESDDGHSVIGKLEQATQLPDVLLVDLSLPPDGKREFTGVDVTDAVRLAYPDMKIVILSIHQDENFITQLIQHGAHGYLVKDCDPQEVYNAILSVHRYGSYINERTLKAIQNNYRSTTRQKVPADNLIRFTRREEEIMQLICQQLTSEEIGEKLFISVKTVNGHRNNLLQKTGSRNTAGLVIYAIKHQLATV
jgi:two-component system, NarL family, response regulator NreC